MKNIKKYVCLSALMALILTVTKINVEFVYANQIYFQANNNSIPEKVVKKAYSKIYKDPIPTTRAYEKKINKWVEVPVLFKNTKLRSVPTGGRYSYTFSHYDPHYVKRNWHFDVVSIYRVYNNSGLNINTKYILEQNVIKKANVSIEISGKAKIKAAFLGAVEAKAGFKGTFEKKWSKGWSADISTKIPPHHVAYITNYQVGVNSKGALVYDKRTPTGAKCGEYKEETGGTVLSDTDINIEVTEMDPMVK